MGVGSFDDDDDDDGDDTPKQTMLKNKQTMMMMMMMMMMLTIMILSICSNNRKSQEVKQYSVMWQTMQQHKGYTCYTGHLFLFAMPFFGGCHCIHRKD